MSRWTLALLLVALAAPAPAKIYKWIMPDGTIQYSDTPQAEGAEPVELDPLQTYEAPPAPQPESARDARERDESKGSPYLTFEVASPANDEVLRDNAGNVSIRLSVRPSLSSGHTVEIFMDGESLGRGRGTSISLVNVDRGTHDVHAVIRDEEGNELARTPGSTFHLKRASALN